MKSKHLPKSSHLNNWRKTPSEEEKKKKNLSIVKKFLNSSKPQPLRIQIPGAHALQAKNKGIHEALRVHSRPGRTLCFFFLLTNTFELQLKPFCQMYSFNLQCIPPLKSIPTMYKSQVRVSSFNPQNNLLR